jgi:uncharacterized delta-60 repeat protein
LEARVVFAAGDLDRGYAYNGLTALISGNLETSVLDGAIDSNGRAVTAVTNTNNDWGFLAATAAGHPDSTFGNGNGYVAVDFGQANEVARAIVIASGNKVTAVGDVNGQIGVARLNNNGTLDTTFDVDGKLLLGTGSGRAVAIQSDGKILVAGSGPGQFGMDDFVVFRLNTDGSLDNTFGTAGEATINIFNLSTDQALGVTVQGDGRIVVVGSASRSGYLDTAVVRLLTNGTLDTSFNGTGKYVASLGNATDNDWAHSAVIQTDGKIVVAGGDNESAPSTMVSTLVTRFNSDGTLDTAFGTAGTAKITGVGASNHFVGLQSDGKILTVGTNSAYPVALRLLSDGRIDPTFKPVAGQVLDQSTHGPAASAAVYNGDIYLFGYGQGNYSIIKARQLGLAADSIVGRVSGNWWGAIGGTAGTLPNVLLASWSNSVNWINVFSADVTGDGYDDLVARNAATGEFNVSVNNHNGTFAAPTIWGTWLASANFVDVQVGDVDGDGRADLVGRVDTTAYWWVAVSNGAAFTVAGWMQWPTAGRWVDVFVTDMNGDARSDVVGRDATTGQWNVGLSNGTTFTNSVWATWSTTANWVDVQAGDVDGDARSDIAGRVSSSGQWWVALSTGTSLASATVWTTWSAAVTWADVHLVDVTGDGRADLVGRVSNNWWIGTSNGTSSFTNTLWNSWPTGTFIDNVLGDFDGDGRLDIAGRRNGEWWVLRNTGNTFAAAAQWGLWSNSVTWQNVQAGTHIA